ncbi:hypothetical protein [Pseudonocardia sp. GCM10023141]|uniref:hypothetical protein n=1 Tax=Pseudonocardia sp. GCM10023141 TaxID=3252653 RepID=UPI00360EB1C6
MAPLERWYDTIVAAPPRLGAWLDDRRPALRDPWGGPLNGQPKRQQIVRDLHAAIGFEHVVETGTHRGSSTAFFAVVCGVPVSTVELIPRLAAYCRRRLAVHAEVAVTCGDSRRFLRDLAARPQARQETALFYLDAHGDDDLPLAEELEIIAESWANAVVMIDDFEVPTDPGYGYDNHGPGKALTLAYLPRLPGWRTFFPAASAAEEAGARRGCVVLASPSLGGVVETVPSLVRGPDDRGAAPAGEVAVTYDNSNSDGVGSQLQRIFGLWALSRDLGIRYVHTPLGRVGYQGLMPLLEGHLEPDFVDRFNAFFTLPSDEFDRERCEVVTIHGPTPHDIEQLRERAAATGRPVLVSACHPFNYTDHVPEACSRIRVVSPYRHHRPTGPIRVCVHLRRGDNSFTGRHDRDERLQPNAYYLQVLATLTDELARQGLPFVIRIHTEVPPHAVTLQPGAEGIYFRLDEPGTVDPAEIALEEFAAVPNVEVVANVDPKEVLDDFATADILVLSRSSLGYFAGQLNPHGVIVYSEWWHPPLPGWLVATQDGGLDRVALAARLAQLARGRRRIRRADASVRAVNQELRDRGYVACKGLLEPSLARVLWTTLLLNQWRGEAFRDNHVPTAASVAGSATTDALLLDLRPRIEEISGCHLVPTYSYARLYFRGDGLIRHRDRQACEISVSIHLGRVGGDGSLCFGADDRVDMDEGDGAVYLGCATDHWRAPFAGYTMGQVFLHYVDRDGPYAQQAFDGRPERFPTSLVTDLTAPTHTAPARP